MLRTQDHRGSSLLVPVSVILFLSGAAGLLYEVVWFRRLHLVFGVSVFAIGAVVAAFMLGLAAGSRWAASSTWLRKNPLRSYAWLEIGIAVFAAIFPFLIQLLEGIYIGLFRLLEGSFLVLSITRFVLALVVLLPPTFLMGATLPVLAQAVTVGSRNMARIVGWLYAINTFGGVVGTLLAGFFALEHLGIIGSLRLGLVVNVTVAVGALLLSRYSTYRKATPRSDKVHDLQRERERENARASRRVWTGTMDCLADGPHLNGPADRLDPCSGLLHS